MIRVALSGGLDSCVIAMGYVVSRGKDEVAGVAFRYGQRHEARELAAAHEVAALLAIPLTVIDIPPAVLRSPALIDGGEVPEGHYLDPAMADTVVPGRNLLFASLLVSLSEPGDTVALGIQGGEGSFYPDSRPSFVRPLARAVAAAYGVEVSTPIDTMSKDEVIAVGVGLGAPLGATWSCYNGGDLHCGHCSTCVKRAEAFDRAGVPDPTAYADPDYWRTVTA